MKKQWCGIEMSRRRVMVSGLMAGCGLLIPGTVLGSETPVRDDGEWHAVNQALDLLVRKDGSYEVRVFGRLWFVSQPTSIHYKDCWYAATPEQLGTCKRLQLIKSDKGTGNDKIGSYKWFSLSWKADTVEFDTVFRIYDEISCLVFSQRFPNGGSDLALPERGVSQKAPEGVNGQISATDVANAFPSFKVSRLKEDVSYLSYAGCMAHPQRGRLLNDFYAGTQAGVPLVLFDERLDTVVLSPLNHFANSVQVKSEVLPDCLAVGLSGRVNEVPSGFNQETILFAGRSVNQTVFDWGSQLLKLSGKSRREGDDDTTLNYLGYWTDAGAFYYYNTEPGKDYETTVLDVADHIKQQHFPAAYFQLDSWWYLKGKDQGTALWEPRLEVFKHGMKWLTEKIGLPFAVHNRYWSSENQYREKFKFITDATAALPVDENFWLHIMSWARENGIILYEQDWLNVAYERVQALQKNVLLSEEYLGYMDRAAQKIGMKILYCMPLPSHYLLSTLFKSVTQIRASGDYCPGDPQWNIGMNAILCWALGLAPFKDVFWSSEVQSGSTYKNGNATEPNFELHALVSSLSRGPVAPGDKIGCFNMELIRKTCRSDGLLLKPDKPATPIERCFKPNNPAGEMWDTYTRYGEQCWRFLLVADQKTEFQLTADDLQIHSPHAVFETRTGKHSTIKAKQALTVGGTMPPRLGAVAFQYFVFAPMNVDGLAFLGETNKFISVSRQRFKSIDNNGKCVVVAGVAGEEIELSWRFHAPCSLKLDGESLPGDQTDYRATTGNTVKTSGKSGVLTVELKLSNRGEAKLEIS